MEKEKRFDVVIDSGGKVRVYNVYGALVAHGDSVRFGKDYNGKARIVVINENTTTILDSDGNSVEMQNFDGNRIVSMDS